VTTRTCKWRECRRLLITQRADAEFCGSECKNAWHNEERRKQGGAAKRFKGQESGIGSRGGNVRDLNEARGLQEEQKEKAHWTLTVREQIARTLLETGYFHADDLDALEVPPAHCNVKGSQIGSFRSRKLMEKTGVERKVAHAAANGRKAPIYRVTAKGHKELSKMLVGMGGGDATAPSLPAAVASGANALHPGEKPKEVDSGVPNPQGSGGALDPLSRTGVDSDGDSSAAGTGVAGESAQSQRGRDLQVRGAGSGEDRGSSVAKSDSRSKSVETSQPARLVEKPEPLTLLPEPDPEAWAA
jgi:hypothetical protein